MAIDCEATDFEWVDPIAHSFKIKELSAAESSDFLKEGYLHVMEKLSYRADGSMSTLTQAMKLMRSLSDPAILGSWSRRWCVLSRTPDGLHLLLYKDQSSFSNLHSPCAVVRLDKCLKLSSLPTHNKSENTFAITLERRDILFYTDKSSELEQWLKVLEDALQLQDAYCHSPLKGLPQQKARRKESLTTPTPSPDKEFLPSAAIPSPQKPSPHVIRDSRESTSSHSAAVAKGILATTAPYTDYSGTMRKERSNSMSSTIGRSMSFSRKNSEPPVQILQVKKLNT